MYNIFLAFFFGLAFGVTGSIILPKITSCPKTEEDDVEKALLKTYSLKEILNGYTKTGYKSDIKGFLRHITDKQSYNNWKSILENIISTLTRDIENNPENKKRLSDKRCAVRHFYKYINSLN